jgi:hypothetical protein
VAVVQYTFTHKQYTEQHTKKKQYIEQHKNKLKTTQNKLKNSTKINFASETYISAAKIPNYSQKAFCCYSSWMF